MAAAKIHHVSIQGDTGEDAESDTVDSEYARHAAAFAAARKRKASYHYQGKNCTVYTCLNLDLSPSCDLDTGKSTVFILLFSFLLGSHRDGRLPMSCPYIMYFNNNLRHPHIHMQPKCTPLIRDNFRHTAIHILGGSKEQIWISWWQLLTLLNAHPKMVAVKIVIVRFWQYVPGQLISE